MKDQYSRILKSLSFIAVKGKFLWGVLAYSLTVLIIIFFYMEGSVLSDINLWFSFGLLPSIIAVYGYYYRWMYKQRIIQMILSQGFNRKYLLCSLFIFMFAIIFVIFVIYYIFVLLLYGFLELHSFNFNPLRYILAIATLYMYCGYALLIATIVKSFMKFVFIYLVSVNVVSLIALLSVNILDNGYIANYFTTMAFANALLSSDYSSNYVVTVAIYLVLGVSFNMIAYAHFKNADLKPFKPRLSP
jgi:ABC-type transport system involved in multi-copper enzyme maturation permease subunit